MEIKYNKVALMFLDVLGFADMVQQQDKLQEIVQILEDLDKHTNVEGFKEILEIQKVQFSDSILIWSSLKSPGIFFTFLLKIQFAMSSLHLKKIFTRGAISYGDHYFEKNILVSPALVEAYRAEQSVSVYPRVVLTPSFIDHLTELFPEEEIPNFLDIMSVVDSDSHRYLNYMVSYGAREKNETATEAEKRSHLILLSYTTHKNVILEKIQITSGKVRAKYIWLGKYHNLFLKRESTTNKEINASHFIDESLLKL